MKKLVEAAKALDQDNKIEFVLSGTIDHVSYKYNIDEENKKIGKLLLLICNTIHC